MRPDPKQQAPFIGKGTGSRTTISKPPLHPKLIKYITNQVPHLLEVRLPLLLHPSYFYHTAPTGVGLVYTPLREA